MSSKSTFISYARKDSSLVHKMADVFEKTGIPIWIDRKLKPSERWDDSIEAAIKDCDKMLVILSEASINSQNVKDEYSYAIDSEKTVIPFLLEDCEVPFRLRRPQYINYQLDKEVALTELSGALGLTKKQVTILSKSEVFKPKKKKKKKTRWVLLVILLALGVLGYQFWDTIRPFLYNEPATVKILIQESGNNEGHANCPIQAEVALKFNDSSYAPAGNIENEYVFRLPETFRFSETLASIDFNNLDTNYRYELTNDTISFDFTKDSTLIAEVVLKTECTPITGSVHSATGNIALGEVYIEFLNHKYISDSLGGFSLNIPNSMLENSLTLKTTKNGFEDSTHTFTINSNYEMNDIILKEIRPEDELFTNVEH